MGHGLFRAAVLGGGNLSVLGEKFVCTHGAGSQAVGRGMLSDVRFCRHCAWLRAPRSRQGAGNCLLPFAIRAVTALADRNDISETSADISPR